jgi:hypothetical protein
MSVVGRMSVVVIGIRRDKTRRIRNPREQQQVMGIVGGAGEPGSWENGAPAGSKSQARLSRRHP